MYWTRSPGSGGRLLTEDDFVVEEIPHRKFLAKYARSGSGVSRVSGPYFLYRLWKKGTTTRDALEKVAEISGVRDIGFAGLKDKFAVTTQYITLKKEVANIEVENIRLSRLSPCPNMMQVGELEGNKFVIKLHGCRNPENALKILEELKARGMPNYFGPQRFGAQGNNHEIGLSLLRKEYDAALDMTNKSSNKPVSSLAHIDKRLLKFFVNAYQSAVFNRVLDAYVSENSAPFYGRFILPGYNTKFGRDFASAEARKVLEADSVDLGDFELKDLRIRADGSSRKAFVRAENAGCSVNGDAVTLRFSLPPGSYATVLVGEVVKSGRKDFLNLRL